MTGMFARKSEEYISSGGERVCARARARACCLRNKSKTKKIEISLCPKTADFSADIIVLLRTGFTIVNFVKLRGFLSHAPRVKMKRALSTLFIIMYISI